MIGAPSLSSGTGRVRSHALGVAAAVGGLGAVGLGLVLDARGGLPGRVAAGVDAHPRVGLGVWSTP